MQVRTRLLPSGVGSRDPQSVLPVVDGVGVVPGLPRLDTVPRRWEASKGQSPTGLLHPLLIPERGLLRPQVWAPIRRVRQEKSLPRLLVLPGQGLAPQPLPPGVLLPLGV